MVSSTSIGPKMAGEMVGRSKAAIIKAIREGRLSAAKDANGQWCIEPVELLRVYRPVNDELPKVGNGTQVGQQGLQAEIEHLRELLARADQRADEWKARAEEEGRERRQLMALLTDQREEVQEVRRSIWSKLLGR